MPSAQRTYSAVIRCAHWMNLALMLAMIYSGLLIYWADPVYEVRFGGTTLVRLFPEWFFAALGVPYRLAEGMALHFFFMWLFAINGLVYVGYAFASGEAAEILPKRGSLRDALQTVLHDLHLSDVEPSPSKFNGAQRIVYTTVILMGGGSLITGLANYKPVQLAWLVRLLGGYEWVRWEHFWLAFGYVAFAVVHVIQIWRAGWNHFRAMVTGSEIEHANG